MKIYLKIFAAVFLGAAALVSMPLMAQVVTVPTTISDIIPNGSDNNGGLIFTIFSVNEDTPWSYSYNLGLRLDDVSSATSDFGSDLKSLTWNLPTLDPAGNLGDLRWHVTAADLGSNAVSFSGRFLGTAVPGDTPTANTGNVNSATVVYKNFVNELNAVAGTPDITTDPSDPRFAPANFGVTAGSFNYDVAGKVDQVLEFYLLTSGHRNQGANGQITISGYYHSWGYAMQWTLDLSHDTLTWNVVPLPAAAWLLLSGLFGLGAVSCRRSQA